MGPDGVRLATAGDDGAPRLWDTRTGAKVATLIGHNGPTSAVVFSPDGARLATASSDYAARLWDASTTATMVLAGHTGPVYAVAFSPDGTRLATASTDGTARLWDTSSGEAMGTLAGHTGSIEAPGGAVDRPALAQSCIGQREVRWTPLQAALVAATVANDGVMMRPYVIDTVQDANLVRLLFGVGVRPTSWLRVGVSFIWGMNFAEGVNHSVVIPGEIPSLDIRSNLRNMRDLFIPGVIVYLVLRPAKTIEEEYLTTLEEEALLRAIEGDEKK